MLHRIQQLYAALTASISASDEQYVASLLDKDLQQLFYGMDVVDQRHALDVAYICRQEFDDNPLLLRAALLHDVAKRRGDLNIFRRVLVVLLATLAPQLANTIGHNDKASGILGWKQALYLYRHHPRLGADYVRIISNDPKLVWLIENHHSLHSVEHTEMELVQLLRYLQQADERC